MTIEELLTNWKNDALFSERYFEKQSITLIEGQKLYLISVRCNISVDKQNKLIEMLPKMCIGNITTNTTTNIKQKFNLNTKKKQNNDFLRRNMDF